MTIRPGSVRHLAGKAVAFVEETVENRTSDCVMANLYEGLNDSWLGSTPERARIVAKRNIGSAALLNGLTCRVVGAHPIAIGWVKIALVADPDELEKRGVKYRDWSIAANRLVPLGRISAAADDAHSYPQSFTIS